MKKQNKCSRVVANNVDYGAWYNQCDKAPFFVSPDGNKISEYWYNDNTEIPEWVLEKLNTDKKCTAELYTHYYEFRIPSTQYDIVEHRDDSMVRKTSDGDYQHLCQVEFELRGIEIYIRKLN